MTSMDTHPSVSTSENVDAPELTKSKESPDAEAADDLDNSSDKETKHRPPPVDIAAAQSAAIALAVRTSSVGQTPQTPGARYDTFKDKERKIGHRRVDHGGKVTYKKIGTNQIMGSIQLGIQQAVGSLASKPELDVLIQDFYVVETIIFPNDGSQSTPAHGFSEFRFKVYAPIAFRHFRDLFKIQPDDYLMSLCDEPLRELSNPGASGSIFYLTIDDEFIIKTVQHKEAEFLQKLLPGYYMNLNQNPRTLLPKFFGLYTYQCNAKNIRLIVMNNLLPSSIKMHQKYDLKGSTYKRKANKYERKKNSPTFKDLDFMEHYPNGILLEAETWKALIKTIERDCRVLMSFKIMDYSLLVGIHNLDQAARERASKNESKVNGADGPASSEDGADGGFGLNRSRSINRQKLVAHSTAMESIQADADPIDEEEHVPPGGIPARNVKGERLLLFLGIIDILQSYRLKKKLEHTVKAVIHDGDTISVHRPTFYAERFQKFMSESVFKKISSPLRHSPSRRRGASVRNVPRPISQVEAETTEITETDVAAKSTEEPPKTSNELTESSEDRSPKADDAESSAKKTPTASVSVTSSDSNTPLNLPAVLQDRPRMRHPPPPVPPRSPRGGQRCPSSAGRGNPRGSIRKTDPGSQEGHPPVGSTPPPTWDAAMTRSPGSPKVRVKSSMTHVTTVAIKDDRTDIIRVAHYSSP